MVRIQLTGNAAGVGTDVVCGARGCSGAGASSYGGQKTTLNGGGKLAMVAIISRR